MFYLIKKDGKYFNSGGSYVESSGYCETPAFDVKSKAWACTSKEIAQSVADVYGGEVVSVDDRSF